MSVEPIVPSGTPPINVSDVKPKSAEELLREIEALRSHNQTLLGEKKNVSEKLKTFEQSAKEKQDLELKAKEDYKSLVELRDTELLTTKKELESERFQRQQGQKLDAFLSVVEGKIDPKYWGMIDLEQVKINPDSKAIDQMSVSQAVEAFKKTYPELIKTGISQFAPPNAPTNGEILTYEAWLTLPLKEQKARYLEMKKNTPV
jgi:vacuolar-type H+-ATPase subunit I/STV1